MFSEISDKNEIASIASWTDTLLTTDKNMSIRERVSSRSVEVMLVRLT